MKESCLILAGEKSGEDHAKSFFPDLKALVPGVDFYGVGGEYLSSQGVELVYHLKDFSSWGISEVVGKIPFYKRALDKLTNIAVTKGTKTAILIDFQDFNLRLAKRLSKNGVNVLYYVAPQAWAWRPWRAKTLGKAVHTLFTILPFEKSWFKERGVQKTIGIIHPLVKEFKAEIEAGDLGIEAKPFYENVNRPYRITILPGSRDFEVKNLLPHFVQAATILKRKYNIEVSIVKSRSVKSELFCEKNEESLEFEKVYDDTELVDALKNSDLAIAASGTVTLTCALFQVPTIVCYQASLLTELIGDIFMTYQGPISLGNIVHDKMIFPEFIQTEVYPERIAMYLEKWLTDKTHYEETKDELTKTLSKISGDPIDIPKYMAEVIQAGESNA